MNYYPEDLDFPQWLALLNVIARSKGYVKRPLTECTGRSEWLAFYGKGMIPADALDAAEQDGELFGAEYDV